MVALQVAKPLVKTIAAAVSLGTGASLGPEGPSVEIGKAFANGLGSTLRSRPRHMLSLMAAGSGAGRRRCLVARLQGVRRLPGMATN
jgi:H+/Cl- antiporter ClcA